MLATKDLKILSQVRIDDAALLYQAGRFSSAYYLAGYAIELAIKVCISRLFRANVIPDKKLVNATYTHDFETLINIAGLKPALQIQLKQDAQFSTYWGNCVSVERAKSLQHYGFNDCCSSLNRINQ